MSGRTMTFTTFFPEYLAAHRDPRTRAIHYFGTTLGVVSAIVFVATLDWRFLVAAPAIGYGLAMPTHPIFEGNLPKTFQHPLLSFMSDFYMLFLWATGRLGGQLARLPPVAGAGVKA